MKMAPIPAWLDEATSALVEETVRMLIKRHANILHHLCRLRGQITLADHASLLVGGYLSRDIDRART